MLITTVACICLCVSLWCFFWGNDITTAIYFMLAGCTVMITEILFILKSFHIERIDEPYFEMDRDDDE